MHVDRVAADVVGRRFQRRIRRAPEVLEQRVADVDVGHVDGEHVAAGAGRARRADDDVAGQVADVRQEFQHAVEIARAQVVVLQGAVQREGPAVRRHRLQGALFPLVDGVDPAAAGDFAFLDVPGIGQHEAIADSPSGHRLATTSTSSRPRAARPRGARTSASARCRAWSLCRRR